MCSPNPEAMTSERLRGAAAIHDGVLQLLGQRYSLRILAAARDAPVAAGELIRRLDVPRTTAYRRLDALERRDLVRVAGRIDEAGAHDRLYRCDLRRLEIAFEDDEPVCTITRRDDPDDPAERWARSWERIRDHDG